MSTAPLRFDGTLPFPFPHLAARAAAAPLGGPREAGLAVLMACRLAVEATGLDAQVRAERAAAGRQWLGTLAVGLPVRAAALRVMEATAEADPRPVAAALSELATAAADVVGPDGRSEIAALVTHITG